MFLFSENFPHIFCFWNSGLQCHIHDFVPQHRSWRNVIPFYFRPENLLLLIFQSEDKGTTNSQKKIHFRWHSGLQICQDWNQRQHKRYNLESYSDTTEHNGTDQQRETTGYFFSFIGSQCINGVLVLIFFLLELWNSELGSFQEYYFLVLTLRESLVLIYSLHYLFCN